MGTQELARLKAPDFCAPRTVMTRSKAWLTLPSLSVPAEVWEPPDVPWLCFLNVPRASSTALSVLSLLLCPGPLH